MTQLIHVLGANIPHHNLTVLRFFHDELSSELPVEVVQQFMVVTDDPGILTRFSALNITIYPDKKTLAQGVCAKAKADRNTRFFFHGQFNPYLWLALITGSIKPSQVYWHIWGADLYEDAGGWRYRLFYRLRRIAQRRIRRVFATRGDLEYYQQRNPNVPGSLLYFPTRMESSLTPQRRDKQPGDPLTILLGNSGDRSNRHLAALSTIKQQLGTNVSLIIPLGYPENNQQYIAEIRTAAYALFGEQRVELLTEKIAFEHYLSLLQRCDLGYFIFRRQQGIGTLCLLYQMGIPVVLSRANPFWQDLVEQQLPVLFSEESVTMESICEMQQHLLSMDQNKIAFFYPAYIKGWLQALTLAAGEEE